MGTNLSAGFFTNKPGPLAGAGLAAMEQDRIAKLELPGALPPENLSILDGSINPTRAAVIVDTEGGAPADDLTAISTTLSDGTTLHEGMELAIRAKDASRVITVKNSAAVNGILTADDKNVVLGTGWWLVLYLENGSWRQKSVNAPVEPATTAKLGLVQIGSNIAVSNDGTISVADASTTKKGVVQLNNTITSNSTTQAATANAVNTLCKSVSNLCMPGTKTTYFSSLGADGYYTAPADGYFQVQGTGGENSWWIVADEKDRHVESGNNYTLSQSFSVMMPIAAGKKMRIQSNNLTSINILFIYAIGAE